MIHIWKSEEMTIGKTHPTLLPSESDESRVFRDLYLIFLGSKFSDSESVSSLNKSEFDFTFLSNSFCLRSRSRSTIDFTFNLKSQIINYILNCVLPISLHVFAFLHVFLLFHVQPFRDNLQKALCPYTFPIELH